MSAVPGRSVCLHKEFALQFRLLRLVFFLFCSLYAFTLWAGATLEEIKFGSPKMVLPSLNGAVFQAERIAGTDLGVSGFSWVGRLQGSQNGFVSFGKIDGKISLKLSFMNGVTYFYRGIPNDFVWAEKTKKPKPCGGCVMENGLPRDPRSAQQPSLSWHNGDANLIDLLVVYPSAVTTAAGSTSAIQADILASVADTNLCYRNSNVNVQLRLVHMEEIVYTPTGIMNTDLDRLRDKTDGSMDSVHDLRDQYGADLVALLTTDSDKGGLASTLNHVSLGFESSAFSVNDWDQIGAPSYTLAHEIGHNMGCLHNREDNDNDTSHYDFNAFCFGKRWIDAGVGYRTVMSYDTNPSSTYPMTIPYFSNPDVSYLGTTTGNAGTEDNALVLRSTAPYVSNFRSSVVQGIVADNYDVRILEGSETTFGVRLAAQPTSPVSVSLSLSGDADILLGSSSTLTFDSSNWNLLQTVLVHARPDADSNVDTATLVLSSTGIPSESVTLTEAESGTSASSDYVVSGTVSNALGVGIEGVTVSFSNGAGSVSTNASGAFFVEVSSGYSGTLSLSKDNYTFSPALANLVSLTQHSLGNSFVGSRSNILYVDVAATGAGDGSSWTDAFTDLGDALRATIPYEEVWVAQGTYTPGLVRSSHFLIPPEKEVYGGFSGNETDRAQRDPTSNPTILSGDIGISNDASDNLFHVVIPSQDSLLDGFTISGGNASENYSDDDRGKGAGLWADSSAFMVSNCIFNTNLAYQGGAGIYLKDANATFVSCVFTDNDAGSTGSGGAAYLEDSNVSFQYCSFESNDAGFEAGAIRWDYSTGSMIDSNFTENRNTASNGGGCLYIKDGSPSILRCRFVQNATLANNYGGAIKFENSSSSVSDSFFGSNLSSSSSGGAIAIDPTSSPTISNNEFNSNQASYGGALVTEGGASPVISSNLFVSNQATGSGGAFYIRSGSEPTFSSNEFRLNHSSNLGGAIFIDSSDLSINGDIYQGNWAENGGAIATQGTMAVSIGNTKALGNEANASVLASASANGGFIYLNSGVTSSLFVNTVFSGNKSNYRSGVLRANGTSRFVNCTLSGNEAQDKGGISILFSSNNDVTQFENCIFWGNTSGLGGNDIRVNTGTATANYSLFNPSESSGTISGSNNVNADPLFTDADGADNVAGTEDDDLSLQSGSPAIDAASSSVSNYPSTDLLGSARSGNPEMGAYEYGANLLPTILTGSSVSMAENTTAVVTVNASDPDGDSLAYSISGGADQALFTINSSTGALVFNTAPDYESPGDSGADNVYNLQIEVSDGSVSSTLDLEVTVTNVNEVPVMSTGSSVSVSENTTAVVTVSATDPDAGSVLTYSISGGLDQALFTINANTGALGFNTAPDYESPGDSGGDNVYELQVSVSDGINSDSINLSVTVADLNEPNQSNHVVNLNDSVSLEMIWVESGTFTMGSPVGEAGRNANETAHQVTLTEGFYLGKYEVTQAQYEVVMTGNTDVGSDGNIVSATPSNWPNNPDYPVEMVSWDDIQIFLSRLNSQQSGNIPSGWAYVLPTEAEWEYACRAGTSTLYSWGDTIGAGDANYQDSGNAQPEVIGSYTANPWGFFDMHGNVFERVQDFYQEDLGTATVIDPFGAQSGGPVIKGGSWFRTGDRLRSAYRSANAADARSDNVGFRLAFKEIYDVSSPPIAVRSNVSAYGDLTVDLNITEEVTLLIRALGPSLEADGKSTDTVLRVYDENWDELDSNDDWGIGASTTSIRNAGLAPGDAAESALVITLQAGVYSLEALDGALEEGVIQLEVYGLHTDTFDEIGKVVAHAEFKAGASFHNINVITNDLNASFNFDATDENQVPPILFTDSSLVLPESTSPGTPVAHFASYGKSGFDQATATFSWVAGDNHNSLFTLESNGTLKTAVPFTYDNNQTSYLLQVQVKDNQDIVVDSNFTVLLEKDLTGLQFERILSLRAGVPAWESMFISFDLESRTNFVVRARGPSLGIPGAASDVSLWIEAAVLSPDLLLEDWNDGTGQYADQLGGLGLAPTEPLEVADFITLHPGLAKMEVDDWDGDMGIAEIEIFALSADHLERLKNLKVYGSVGNELGFQNSLMEVTAGDVIDLSSEILLYENQPIGSLIGKFEEYDYDLEVTRSFSLASGSGDHNNSLFTLEANGTLRTAVTFDYETDAANYIISVEALDEDNNLVEGNFTVSLKNVFEDLDEDGTEDHYDNDIDGDGFTNAEEEAYGSDPRNADSLANAPPTDLNSTAPLTFFENQPIGTVVGEFNATDTDIGASLSYHFVSGEGDDDNSLFILDPNGTLKTTTLFDFESDPLTYRIRVEVRDQFDSSVEAIFSVVLQDANEAPSITSGGSFTIGENTSLVATILAMDPEGSALSFAVIGGEDGSLFTITPGGELSFTLLPDYETPADTNGDNEYEVEVQAEDPLGLRFSQSLTIVVTDANEAPSITSGGSFTISENTFLVTTILAIDPEETALSFAVIGGEDGSLFTITPEGELRFVSSPDFEDPQDLNRNNLHYVEVGVTDLSGLVGSQMLIVTVEDVVENLPPTDLNTTAPLWLYENQGVGTKVGAFTAIDPDNDNLTFHFASGPGDFNNADFTLDINGSLTSAVVFDFEEAVSRSIRVQVRDDLQASMEAAFEVIIRDLDEEAPVIVLHGLADIGLSAGTSFMDEGATWTDNLDGTGTLLGTGDVDTSVPGVYTLDYTHTDQAGNTALSVKRTVTVTNENPTSIFLSQNRVGENLPAGTLVGQVSALDPDLPNGAEPLMNFEILAHPDASTLPPFEIDQGGALRTTASLDFEEVESYPLMMRVVDPYGGSLDWDFVVVVVDHHTPIVDTILPEVEESGRVRLKGKLLDAGTDEGDVEYGFWVGTSPGSNGEDTEMERVLATLDESGDFTAYYYPQLAGSQHYVYAYGENREGRYTGLEERFVSSPEPATMAWAEAEPEVEAPDWWRSEWFGNYYKPLESPWLLHQELGWLFPMPSSRGGVWLWSQDFSWLWTDEGVYPYLFRHQSEGWLYFFGKTQNRGLFYDYQFESWISWEEMDSSD